jgi:hypothetical protein
MVDHVSIARVKGSFSSFPLPSQLLIRIAFFTHPLHARILFFSKSISSKESYFAMARCVSEASFSVTVSFFFCCPS